MYEKSKNIIVQQAHSLYIIKKSQTDNEMHYFDIYFFVSL
jgi:hypothetical protein